jgi:hypothetical protein
VSSSSPLDRVASFIHAQKKQSPENTPSSRYSPLQFANQCLDQIDGLLDEKDTLPSLKEWESYLDRLSQQWEDLLALGQLPFDPSLQQRIAGW